MADDGRIPGVLKSPTPASMREHRIAALERRLATQQGEVRQRLEARLEALAVATQCDARTPRDATDMPAAPGPLAELAAAIADRSPATSYPQLDALGEFRALWSRLRADSQLRQSLQQDTEDSGPLNSVRLAHRTLVLMRGCSPGYTQHFLSYLDTLSWMEQFDGGNAAGAMEASRHAGAKLRTKRKPRKRSD